MIAIFTRKSSLRILLKSEIFCGLDAKDLDAIASAARCCEINRHGFFFRQGEPAEAFFVLLEGTARLSQITLDGRHIIMDLFGPGDVMGFAVVLANALYPGTVEATTDCIALVWDRSSVAHLTEQYPQLAVNGLVTVAKRLWELQKRYGELATQRVERRLANAILRLSRQEGSRDPQLPSPTLFLSRQDLADMTGTTLFSVSRICSQWEQRGLLDSGREQIRILRPEELLAIAEDFAPDA